MHRKEEQTVLITSLVGRVYAGSLSRTEAFSELLEWHRSASDGIKGNPLKGTQGFLYRWYVLHDELLAGLRKGQVAVV